MPLLVPPAAGTDLTQGDLVKVDALHTTRFDGNVQSIGGVEYALVLSRDCVAEHKGKVVVATVVSVDRPLLDPDDTKRWAKDIADGANDADVHKKRFDVLLRALQHYRDGSLSPDRFYLGPVPGDGSEQRFVAHLDELATLYVPTDPTKLASWLASNRKACLEDQARKALGTRIFWAFTRVGFDDHEWLPDPDLRAVCAAGEAALHAMRSAAASARVTREDDQAAGRDAKALAGRDSHIAKLDRDADLFEAQLKPFLNEKGRRDGT